MDGRPLILTARFDPELLKKLDGLRRMHFPSRLNFLTAHLTLFHALPGEKLESIRDHLLTSPAMEGAACTLPGVRFTGRGCHAVVQCEPLQLIQESLRQRWRPWLTPQDQQKFHPHVTIQNKTDAVAARRLFEELRSTWAVLAGRIVGLDLWHYAGGPWEAAGSFGLVSPVG